MPIETNVKPTGTGQQGAGSPAGAKTDIPAQVSGGKPVDKMDNLANKFAKKGRERQHRENNLTPFTK
jgi:hypothetical protein